MPKQTTTANTPKAAIDPGGTRSTKAHAGKKPSPQKVKSGDRNSAPSKPKKP
jgi:hypothetical protein